MAEFRLSDSFIEKYIRKRPDWGPIGYITYKSKYARPMEGENRTEEWWETARRVVEGCYSIQKEHCETLRLPWNHNKAQKSAQEMYNLMWEMKFLPPGRGLWMMGTEFVKTKGSAALNNCGFVSTKQINVDLAEPFCFLMDMSMLGVGVGGDTKGAGLVRIKEPRQGDYTFTVEDSREGWIELIRVIIEAYAGRGSIPKETDYINVRPYGAPIKTFGGTSSGPGPLMQLVQDIKDILDPLAEETITSEAIVDLFNAIGRCVVSGNVRRSAEIMLGDAEDKDFLSLKDHSKSERHAFLCGKDGWRWASNNSILARVGMDYSKPAEYTKQNGEIGYFWLDTARRFGRLCDPENNADELAEGCNPCVTVDTWIHTPYGPRQVSDLINKEFFAQCDGQIELSKTGFFKTKKSTQIYRLVTKEGYSIRVTGDHKVKIQSRAGPYTMSGWLPANELMAGRDYIYLSECSLSAHWEGDGKEGEGYILGLLTGDGTIKKNKAVLSAWSKGNPGYQGILDAVLKAAKDMPARSNFQGWTYIPEREEYRLSLAHIDGLCDKYNLDKEKQISSKIEKASLSFYRGFLRGFFDADGSVQGTQQKGVSIRLSQADLGRLEAVQRMLLRMNIVSTIYKNRKEAGQSLLPDGKGNQKLYPTKAQHELVISGESMKIFHELVGFSDIHKQQLLDSKLSNYKRKLNKDKYFAEFVELIPDGTEDVYDATVEEMHCFDGNGLILHNCGEQTLESYELCCLVETFPARHENPEDYLRTLKFAYLYAKTVTLVSTHNARTNAVMLRNRRIGTSQSGIVQSFRRHGIRTHFTWCRDGYEYIRDLDRIYSRWLCVPQSIKVTSVKPSGTISLLPGATPGVHFPPAEYYWRTQRFDPGSPFIKALRAAGYRIEDDGEGGASVVYFPVKEEHFYRSREDITIWEQLEIAAQMQAYWSDNQVSVTITFKPEERDQIELALQFYETRLKAVSFLPLLTLEEMQDMGHKHPPYQAITKEEYEVATEELKSIRLRRVKETQGFEKTFCDSDRCYMALPSNPPDESQG